ncbi:MAG: exosome complex RNA-binding protein Csl4 [Candidatus Thermoplasmatota archaeon]|nr:exosome complex RNA-binding protein Csl4 [Candidatus Thermoplasmatota archaeon]MDI6887056.1 exosome complex RNA-binding protein Csl4 [Candidatus Thermoplasmatota archaeon]
MKNTKDKIVLPGELIGTAEEFIAGEGTFEEGNKIFASVAGVVERDPGAKTIRVIAINKPCVLKKGDIIIGSIVDMRDVFATVEILKVIGKTREPSCDRSASLHISKIDKYFVESISKIYKIGDIIKAEVIQVSPSTQLSTMAREFGVVKAFCSLCRAPLKLKLNKLFCESCKRTELRKFASEYGKGFS